MDWGRIRQTDNRPSSYSEKESQSNDTLLHFVEFSNVHNTDRSSNATRSNLVYKNNARSRLFCIIAKRSIFSLSKVLAEVLVK